MSLKALYLNCTLKRSPDESNTCALIAKSQEILEAEGVETEAIRILDHYVPHGMAARVDDKDEWPMIFDKVMAAQIVVIAAPIWLGEKSSVAMNVIERLYASSGETNENGQYIYYNKVGGAMATGNEDGGKATTSSILYALQHIGFTIPPQADAYWVGEAGPGPSYIEAGQENAFTRRNTRIMSWNLIHFARRIAENPIPAEGNVREDPEDHVCKR